MELIETRRGRITPLGPRPKVVGPPLSIVFAYSQNGWTTLDGLFRAFQKEFEGVPNSQRIDLIFILDHAMIIGWSLPNVPTAGLYRPCCSAEAQATSETVEGLPYSLLCHHHLKDLSENFLKLDLDRSGLGLITFLQILLKFIAKFQLPSPADVVSKYSPNVPLWSHRLEKLEK